MDFMEKDYETFFVEDMNARSHRKVEQQSSTPANCHHAVSRQACSRIPRDCRLRQISCQMRKPVRFSGRRKYRNIHPPE
jgi:hypothetical protein